MSEFQGFYNVERHQSPTPYQYVYGYNSLLGRNRFQSSFPILWNLPIYPRGQNNFPPNIHMDLGGQPRIVCPNFPLNGFMGSGNTLNDGITNVTDFVGRRANLRVPFKLVCYPLVCYNAVPSEEYQIKQMECSNRIIAPDSVIQQLCQYENIVQEHVFQINMGENRVSIGKYYTNATADQPNAIYVPQYIFESLGIEWGAQVTLNFINESIRKGTFARLQPLTNQITEIDDYQTYMQEHLQANYTCLIKGQVIKFPYLDSEIVMIIHDLQPADIVSITNTDLAIDFEPSVEQREIEHQREETLRMEQEKAFAELEKMKEASKLKPIVSETNLSKQSALNVQTFVPFGGKGHVLSSSQNVVSPTTVESNPSNVFKLNFMKPLPNPKSTDGTGGLDKNGKGNRLDSIETINMPIGSDVKPEDVRVSRLKFLEKLESSRPKPTLPNFQVETVTEEQQKPNENAEEPQDDDIIDLLDNKSENSSLSKIIPKAKEKTDEKKKKLKVTLKKKKRTTHDSE
jgi:hypothetical protein